MEFEGGLFRERTMAGLQAKVRGHYGGKPRTLDEDKLARRLKVEEIYSMLGVGTHTLYEYLAEAANDGKVRG